MNSNESNSIAFIAHSQGNYFVEDILNNSDFTGVDKSRIKVISLGSPTDYFYSGLDENSLYLDPETGNTADPVPHLRLGEITSLDAKLRIFLNGLQDMLSDRISGLGIHHSLDRYSKSKSV